MNTTDYAYAIGDVVKIRKMLHLERFQDKPVLIMERWKITDTNEYKVIVCGFVNEFYYFVEKDIVGKYIE